jgi:hypothetical protein
MFNTCCKCKIAIPNGMVVITPWGLSPNLCDRCLPAVQHGDSLTPPTGLLVLKEGFETAYDITNCCKSAMQRNN